MPATRTLGRSWRGFAPYTGGCASYMDRSGVFRFVAEADALAEKYGDRFKVPQLLRDMAANGETFYSRFPPGGEKKKQRRKTTPRKLRQRDKARPCPFSLH